MPRAQQANRDDRHWIRHGYFRTYAIAGVLASLARDPWPYIRELEDMTVDNGVLAFVAPWQEITVVHRFAGWVADRMFLEDTSGPFVELYPKDNPFTSEPVRRLPVDLALNAHGITDDAFDIPPLDDHSVAENACYDYFTESLVSSEVYERLLNQIGDEVFHIVFWNRAVLAGLNTYLARHVQDIDPMDYEPPFDEFDTDGPLVTKHFESLGRLKRRQIPMWARRAVFFRDQGRCAGCGTNLSGLIDALPAGQFDHIVPLAQGGLNDVTNMQLLCEPCNKRKSGRMTRPSAQYRRWYPQARR